MFLVISVVIEFSGRQSLEIKDYMINFIIIHDEKNSSRSIIRDVCLYDKLSI